MLNPNDPDPPEVGDADWEFYDDETDDEWGVYAQKLREEAEHRRRNREEAKQAEPSGPAEPPPLTQRIPPNIRPPKLVSPANEPVDASTDSPSAPAIERTTSTDSGCKNSEQSGDHSRLTWLLALGAAFVFALGGLIIFGGVGFFGSSEDVVVAEPEEPPAEITNSIGMKLRLIPEGEFVMGSPESDDDADDDERPQHQMQITKPFYLGLTEVTQGQWEAVMGTRPWSGKRSVTEGSTYPAVYVSWDDAQAFCERLSEKEGVTYRLPTEAEWECACRAGTTTVYHFGDDASRLGEYAWFYENAYDADEKYAHRVGQKEPNPFGFYDMHGNTCEWCSDWYEQDYHAHSPSMDSSGAAGGLYRAYRGGGWLNYAGLCRSASRSWFEPSFRSAFLGFRVALVPAGG